MILNRKGGFMKRYLMASLLTGLIGVAAFSLGWRGSPEPNPTAVFDQTYDAKREVAFEGRIIRVDPDPCVSLPVSSYHMHVQMAKEVVEVHLGPCWYMTGRSPVLKVGDIVSGVGSEATWRSADRRVIVAREVSRGKQVLRLRDASGKPLWH